jgi:hypothetical protein
VRKREIRGFLEKTERSGCVWRRHGVIDGGLSTGLRRVRA